MSETGIQQTVFVGGFETHASILHTLQLLQDAPLTLEQTCDLKNVEEQFEKQTNTSELKVIIFVAADYGMFYKHLQANVFPH